MGSAQMASAYGLLSEPQLLGTATVAQPPARPGKVGHPNATDELRTR